MSNRTKQADKAIREAWKKENSLVQEGKGTRDWTVEQQKQLLEKGKVYDEDGKAFRGHHMKSAEHFPEFQGDPENIQFLSHKEHVAAHAYYGGTRFPCNGYYDPKTGLMMDFGDKPPIPCEVITLSESAIHIESPGTTINEKDDKLQYENPNGLNRPREPARRNDSARPVDEIRTSEVICKTPSIKPPKGESGFIRAIKDVGKFIVDHPAESIEIAGIVVVGIAKVVSSRKSSSNTSNNSYTSKEGQRTASSAKADIAEAIADVIERANRSSPREHEVPGHGQHYHTKNGVIWKEKGPYHRGGNKEE